MTSELVGFEGFSVLGGPWSARSKLSQWGYLRWTPHPVIVTIGDIRDSIRVLIYSYYATMTGWGVLLRNATLFTTDAYHGKLT